jgi:hypothetical protein
LEFVGLVTVRKTEGMKITARGGCRGKARHRAGVFLLLMLAGVSQAQLGKRPEEVAAYWKVAPVGTLSSNGYGTLIYPAGSLHVEVLFVENMAERVAVRGASLTEERVAEILAANAEGNRWDPWRPPRASGIGEVAVKVWMRSDESAMAEWSEEGLRILGPAWNTPPPEEASDAAGEHRKMDGPAVEEAISPHRSTRPSAPDRSPVLKPGYWALDAASSSATKVFLQVGEGGSLIWRFQESGQSVTWRTRGRADVVDDGVRREFVIVEETTQRRVGQLKAHETGDLWVVPDLLSDPHHPVLGRGWFQRPMRLVPVAAGSEETVGAMAGGVVPGMFRQDVLDRCGTPMGSFKTKEGEVLLFPWGEVLLKEGKVETVKGRSSYGGCR